jgi:hypothetical protein
MSAASLSGIIDCVAAEVAAFLAALLIATGLHKLLFRARARAAVRAFAGVPASLVPAAAAAAAAAEIFCAGLLSMPIYRAAGGALAALILGVYLLLMLRAMAGGRRDVDCGCTFGVAQRPLGAYAVARNGILVGAAAFVAVSGAAAAAVAGAVAPSSAAAGAAVSFAASAAPDAAQILPALALLALYGALDQAMGLMPPRAGVSS